MIMLCCCWDVDAQRGRKQRVHFRDVLVICCATVQFVANANQVPAKQRRESLAFSSQVLLCRLSRPEQIMKYFGLGRATVLVDLEHFFLWVLLPCVWGKWGRG